VVNSSLPMQQGLYDPRQERDACGVGFVAHIKGKKSHDMVSQGLQILENLTHRGAPALIRWRATVRVFCCNCPMRSFAHNVRRWEWCCRKQVAMV
jgi:Glutamine amidotransferases class-II